MTMPKWWVVGSAIVAALVVGGLALILVEPNRNLIEVAEFSESQISPNADGDNDLTVFRYTISENAVITLAFENQTTGEVYRFRDEHRRVSGDYEVLFSGVVDGFRLPDDPWGDTWVDGDRTNDELETRLLPNGMYTWTFTVTSDDGETATEMGTLDIIDADSNLPWLSAFDVGPTEFTPNQDGIRDRINVNIYLDKPATLQVYLEDEQGVQTYLARREGLREAGDEGNHEYDYDGGVDQGFRPPQDGNYTIFAVAQDDEGQRIVRTSQITIADSGLPQVEIVPQPSGATVCFEDGAYQDSYFTDINTQGDLLPKPDTICSNLETLTLPVGNLLIFRLTVSNYGDTPIRTAEPFPGTVYEDTQLASTLGEYEESGAWRVGIKCDTSMSDFPWRWALAPEDELTAIYDQERDETYYYLLPGQRAEVWGAVRMTTLIDARNPQPCWAGLIHEDVGIPPNQNNVGRREVELVNVPQ